MLGFEKEWYGSLGGLDISIDRVDIPPFLNSLDINFLPKQGSKLWLIGLPMRLTFSPWRLKILVYSPKCRPDFSMT